jgi:hypothetical protein
MRDIHREVSEGANSYYWKEMKNNPNITREQRVYNTRQVLGDPSVQGAGKFAESMARNVPWANASIQDAVRMMRNLRDNPVAFVLGTTFRRLDSEQQHPSSVPCLVVSGTSTC